MSSTAAVSSTSDFRLGFPDDVNAVAANTARRVIEAAPETDRVYALVSGGHDSLTAMHVVYQSHYLDLDGVIHINTGIGIPETTAFVEERAEALDIPYYEVGAPCDDPGQEHEYRRPHEEYTALIQRFGFPGPGAHKYMYWNLKEKPLSRFLKMLEDDLLLISGVSRHESQNRMENVDASGQQEFLGYPTISPLVEFTPLDVRRYRRSLDLPMSPVKETLEISGECLCGAFSKRKELRMIRLFYPDVYRRILRLEATVGAFAALDDGPDDAYNRWGHNRLKDHEREAMDDPDQMLLCQSCEQRHQCNTS